MSYDAVLLQSYTSGTVTTPLGATGLLQDKLHNFIKGTEVVAEVIDPTPNGVLLSFGGTLAHTPVGLHRLIIHYLLGAVPYTATDDGSGVITGTYCTGTLNHATGVWTLVFDAGHPPATGNLTGDYLYGNPGQDWRVKYIRNTRKADGINDESFTAVCKEVVYHNTGMSGKEDVYIGIREWDYTTGGGMGWDLNAYTVYSTDWMGNTGQHGLGGVGGYSATWKHWNKMPMLPLAAGTSTYWIQSNQQHIKVEVRLPSLRTECIYLGFMRRYGTFTDYPFPIVIKGPVYGDVLPTDNSTAHTGLTLTPGAYTSYNLLVVDPGGTYLVCGGLATSRVYLLPRGTWNNLAGSTLGKTQTANRVPVRPVYVVERDPANQILGDLDGVQMVMGSVGVTDIMKNDTIKHIIFRDPVLSDYYDYFSVAESHITTT